MDQIHVFFRRLDSALGLFLETVQDINPTSELDGVDGAECVAAKVFHHLQHACRPEPSHHLCVLVFTTRLREVYGMPEHVFDVFRHGIQITLGRANPLKRLASLLRHRRHYANLDIILSI